MNCFLHLTQSSKLPTGGFGKSPFHIFDNAEYGSWSLSS